MKSYKFWVALSGGLTIVGKTIAEACGITLDEKLIDTLIMSMCGILVAVGLVEGPKGNSEATAQPGPSPDAEAKADAEGDSEPKADAEAKTNADADESKSDNGT